MGSTWQVYQQASEKRKAKMTYEATVLIASILIGALFGLTVITPMFIWLIGRTRRRPVSRTEQRYTPEVKYSDTKAEAASELNVALSATIEPYADEGWELPKKKEVRE